MTTQWAIGFKTTLPCKRWAAVLLLLMIVPVAISFNARLSTIRQMRQDEARLKRAVATEQVRQADLKSLRSYVSSDAYVEHWARASARMTRPGEVAVIPVASGSLQFNPSGTPTCQCPGLHPG